jgi:hypothetical protein
MQHPVCGVPRISIPRTWVNKGKKQGRGVVPRPSAIYGWFGRSKLLPPQPPL